MSVRGEFRRLGGELLGVYRDAGIASREAAALAPLLERAGDDLTGAAEGALTVLSRWDGGELSDTGLRQRFTDSHERLEAVCRIILGRPA